MSDISTRDVGVIQALVERFETRILPRLHDLKEKVDKGETLNDMDCEFLDRIIDDAYHNMPSTIGHQELHEFCLHVTHYYKEITDKALENEIRKT